MVDIVGKLKLARLGERLARRNPLVYPRVRRLFDRLERADFDVRQTFTDKRLRTVLGWARRSDYGKSVSGGVTINSWPLLDKDLVRTSPEAFYKPSFFPVIPAATSGTTGQPLNLVRSIWSIAAEQAAIDLAASRVGIDAETARIAVLRADSFKDPSDKTPPYWLVANGGRRLVCSSYHLNATTLQHFVEILKTFDPNLLWVYPTTLDSLCRLLSRSSEKLRIRTVLASSEMLSSAVWHQAEETLGCRLVDYYGQAERVAFALASEPGKYRFLPGYAHVELLLHSSDTSHAYYEVIGTPLWNSAMPLVRYRSGDLAQLPLGMSESDLQQVALGNADFSGIIGRSNDYLFTADGSRIAGLNHIPRGVDHLLRLQLIQDRINYVRVLILTTDDFDSLDEQRLLKNVRSKLPGSIEVEIHRVDELEKVASGKSPYVIHGNDVKRQIETAARS